MLEKLKNKDNLFDHELLEVLLYNACPRVNTNPLAHALLERFVSLSEVFNASIDELKEVDGVGDSVARFIKTVGLCAERIGSIGSSPSLKTFGDCKRFIDLRLRGKKEEFVELYFVNKACRVQRIFSYTSAEKSRASVKAGDVARNIALSHPYGVIIAHNHVDDNAKPSAYDDEFTCAVQFICNISGTQLLDHYIYLSNSEIYSYKDSGRLKSVESLCSWENFEKWIKTLN